MIITIVRHGETNENKEKICQGHTHGTLSEKGIEQAKKVGARLKDENYDAIYCSDLDRTKKTCNEIIPFHPGTQVIYSPEIRERCMGDQEGKKWKFNWGEFDILKILDAKYPGGETFRELKARVSAFMNVLEEQHKDDHILIVTHGGPVHTMLMHFLGYNWEETYKEDISNTSVTIIEGKKGDYKAHIIGCTKHL